MLFGSVGLNSNPKYFNDSHGTIALIGSSALYSLSDNVDSRPILDFLSGRVHFIRVFAGRLTPSSTRSGQTPEAARSRLQNLINLCRERALRIEVTCCTDTAAAPQYDVKDHVAQLAKICSAHLDTVISMEMWNEIGHPTQRSISYSELVQLKDIARSNQYSGPIALGASSIDELDPNTGNYPSAWTGPNAFSTMHLDRGKPPSYREACRVKEFYDIRNRHQCGACNNEPARFDDAQFDNEFDGQGHERFAYLLGVLGVGFNFMSIAHGSNLRDCVVPSGVELSAFNEFIRAAHLIPRANYTWYNANNTGSWPDSPIKSGAFMEGPANSNDKALWRAYSFVGARSFTVATGEKPDRFNLEYQNNWRPIGLVDEANTTQVIEIGR